ncbi:MAG: hypothetical protein ACLSXK_04835 [Lactococcus petauri]
MNILKKLLRVFSWVAIVINTLIIIGYYFLGTAAFGSSNTANSAFSIVLDRFTRNPFDFSNSDTSFIWARILMYVIPILILVFVKVKKEQKSPID